MKMKLIKIILGYLLVERNWQKAIFSTRNEMSEEVDFEKKWLMSLLPLKSESTHFLLPEAPAWLHTALWCMSFYL